MYITIAERLFIKGGTTVVSQAVPAEGFNRAQVDFTLFVGSLFLYPKSRQFPWRKGFQLWNAYGTGYGKSWRSVHDNAGRPLESTVIPLS